MLRQSPRILFLMVLLWALPALACNTTPPDASPPLEAVAATAAASAQDLNNLAGTAAAQVATAAPTLQAAASTQVAAAAGTVAAAATTLPTLEAQAEAIGTIVAGLPTGVTMDELKERFVAVQLDENGAFSITITDAEWNQALMARQETRIAAGDPPATQDITFVFLPDRIDLTGRVVSPIQGPLTASFRPYVAAGVFQFEILAATINEVAVPQPLLELAAGSVRETIDELISSLPDGLQLTAVTLQDGVMTITGQRP